MQLLSVRSLASTWFLSVVCFVVSTPAPVLAQPGDKPFPYGQQPIDYFAEPQADPIAQLGRRIQKGELKLRYTEPHGYLLSLLQALDVPVESQVLVFSKTSVNKRLIDPRTPRAIFFNDTVYVGWIPEVPALEISAIDPQRGAMFYSLPQQSDKPPKFKRSENCLACHATSNSLQVPGQLLRSFSTDKMGNPISGLARVNHGTPLAKRWGGWYVSGLHGKQTHLGNTFGTEQNRRHRDDPAFGSNVTNLDPFFNVARYPAAHSDIVALLVLDHQVHAQNLLTRLNYETRLERKPTVEDELLRYLFFIDEPPLTDEVLGTSKFADVFESRGPEDPYGRSLRQFDLKSQLFKYRLSYQIYSPAFQQLPATAKARLYKRIWNVLTGKEKQADFRNIPQPGRQEILEMLRGTLPDLPAYYRQE